MNIIVIVLICFVILIVIGAINPDTLNKGNVAPQINNTSSNYNIEEEIKVVGGFYRSYESKKFIKTLSIDDVVYFLPEPDNAYDSNAVRVVSSTGLHIGYIPRDCAEDVKEELNKREIQGTVSCEAFGTYEFYIMIDSLDDSESRDKAIKIYADKIAGFRKLVEIQTKRDSLDFYNQGSKADLQYDMGNYEKVESIIKPFFSVGIQDELCYELMIKLCHRNRNYEEEEKYIDEYLIMNKYADKNFWKRRKFHILRKMGIIVNDDQIENEKIGVETTVLELDAFITVVDLLEKVVDPNRIDFRDAQTLFAINLDGNIRKPICKLYLNNPSKMYIGIIDTNKSITKIALNSIEDIRLYSVQLEDTTLRYFREGALPKL